MSVTACPALTCAGGCAAKATASPAAAWTGTDAWTVFVVLESSGAFASTQVATAPRASTCGADGEAHPDQVSVAVGAVAGTGKVGGVAQATPVSVAPVTLAAEPPVFARPRVTEKDWPAITVAGVAVSPVAVTEAGVSTVTSAVDSAEMSVPEKASTPPADTWKVRCPIDAPAATAASTDQRMVTFCPTPSTAGGDGVGPAVTVALAPSVEVAVGPAMVNPFTAAWPGLLTVSARAIACPTFTVPGSRRAWPGRPPPR